MANEEKELFKFVNDSKYREKVTVRVHKEQDIQYNKRIKNIESERDKLSKSRTQEITKIVNSRWEKVAGGKILVNRTEGKVKINQTETLFSSIQGAELNMMSGCRVVTTEQAKSKKHASLGGAVAGGLILGPVGAVVGGVGLWKTKTKGTSVSNQIPTCTHLGVLVNIDGFTSEIVLISSQVDKSSISFANAQSQAQTIISQLGALAKTPVPQYFSRPEEESSVKNMDSQIENKQSELQAAIADRPTYDIPQMCRTAKQSGMIDDEYLQYLKETDTQRAADRTASEAAFKQEQAEKKEAAKQQKAKQREARHQQMAENMSNIDVSGTAKKAGNIIYKIVFWVLSVLLLLFFLVAITSDGGALSGTILLLTALLINPLVVDLINKKLFQFPRWICIIILIVGLIAGMITFPKTASNGSSTITSSISV